MARGDGRQRGRAGQQKSDRGRTCPALKGDQDQHGRDQEQDRKLVLKKDDGQAGDEQGEHGGALAHRASAGPRLGAGHHQDRRSRDQHA
jgi:hypothetical protein